MKINVLIKRKLPKKYEYLLVFYLIGFKNI